MHKVHKGDWGGGKIKIGVGLDKGVRGQAQGGVKGEERMGARPIPFFCKR